MPVDRCVCWGVTFERVRELMEGGLGLDEISRRFGCGRGCGLCQPYLRLVIETGRTEFEVLPPDGPDADSTR